MIKIKQYRYNGSDTKWSQNIFSDLEGGEVTQLGIQAKPGTIFYINGSNNELMVGTTGIYELDLTGLAAITQLKFKSLNNNDRVIVDIVYDTLDGV